MKNFTSLAVALLIGDASTQEQEQERVITNKDWTVRNDCEDYHFLTSHRGICGLNTCLFDPFYEQNYGKHRWSCDNPTVAMCNVDPTFKNCGWYAAELESYLKDLEELKKDTAATKKGQKEEDLYNKFEKRIQELRKEI